MNINNINEFRNSKAYNVITDDPTYGGYMALARVICGVKTHYGYKRINMRDAKKIYGLYEGNLCEIKDEDNKSKRKIDSPKINRNGRLYAYVDIEIKDIKTGKIIKFKNTGEAADFLEADTSLISTYIKKQYIYRKRYFITGSLNSNPRYRKGADKCRKVKLHNINTGEIVVKDSVKEAAEFVGVSSCQICHVIKHKSITRKIWKAEYLEE